LVHFKPPNFHDLKDDVHALLLAGSIWACAPGISGELTRLFGPRA
jgi:hypothetical protein